MGFGCLLFVFDFGVVVIVGFFAILLFAGCLLFAILFDFFFFLIFLWSQSIDFSRMNRFD